MVGPENPYRRPGDKRDYGDARVWQSGADAQLRAMEISLETRNEICDFLEKWHQESLEICRGPKQDKLYIDPSYITDKILERLGMKEVPDGKEVSGRG